MQTSIKPKTFHLIASELIPTLHALPCFDLNDTVLPAVRAGLSAAVAKRPSLPPTLAKVHCEERMLPGPAGAPAVRVLVYTPAEQSDRPRPALLHIHGGGFVFGAPEVGEPLMRSLVTELGCVAVSVAYRLAPETRFPGALEDCYAALLWLHEQAKALHVDRARIAVYGESAGGGHAAALARLALQRGEVSVCLQLLEAPMLDDRTGSTSAAHPHCGEFVWKSSSNRFGWRALLGAEPGSPDVPAQAVPARASDLAGLPPTFIMVGALDLFLEENLEYARRLIRAGVPTELHVIPGAFHGFAAIESAVPLVQTSLRLRRDALARAFRMS